MQYLVRDFKKDIDRFIQSQKQVFDHGVKETRSREFDSMIDRVVADCKTAGRELTFLEIIRLDGATVLPDAVRTRVEAFLGRYDVP